MSWKRWLRDRVVPPAITRWWDASRRPAIQKFWAGTPLSASPREAEYFSTAGLQALTLTRGDDSRNAGKLASTAALPLTGEGDHAQVAIATEAWRAGDRIEVTVGTERVLHTHVSPRQWLDLRLPAPADARNLEIRSTAPAYVTVPRRVRTRETPIQPAQHVLVMVLDGMTPYLRSDPDMDLQRDPATPNINRFFEQGFIAPNGWATGEWTLPTTGSFFTGLYTSRHRMWHPTQPTQMAAVPTLATSLQEAGYHGLALSTANRFMPAYGSHRGFDRFLYHWPFEGHTALDYDPARWCDEVLGHFDSHRHDRAFAYVHFPDTHPCWNVPPLTRAFNLQRRGDSTGHDLEALREHPDAAAQGRQLNQIRLRELDRLLGGVFDFLERALGGQALVVLTADHGTPWAALRPRRPANEPYLVDHRSKVEFRLRAPGVAARRLTAPCSPTIDLMPTVLGLCGLRAPEGIDGRSLLDPAYARGPVISESLYGASYEIAVRDERRTYVEKHPMDEAGRVTGAATFRGCFARGALDYGTPLAGECEDLAQAALAHRQRVGMIEA